MNDQFRRVRLHGCSAKLTREEWDEIDIALGAVAGEQVKEVWLVRDAAKDIVSTAVLSGESDC